MSEETVNAKVIIIADGVSSCKNSRRGAELACKAAREVLLQETEYIFSISKNVFSELFLQYIYAVLRSEAAHLQTSVESFSSTLSFVCHNKITDEVMTFSLGDSLVYAKNETGIVRNAEISRKDADGCVVTTSAGAHAYADIRIFEAKDYSSYFLLTDGAWQLLYDNCGNMKSSLEDILKTGNFRELKTYFAQQKNFDDCSFISMHIG